MSPTPRLACYCDVCARPLYWRAGTKWIRRGNVPICGPCFLGTPVVRRALRLLPKEVL